MVVVADHVDFEVAIEAAAIEAAVADSLAVKLTWSNGSAEKLANTETAYSSR